MKTPIALLEDLESLYTLQKEGGISKDEFQNSKTQIIASIVNDDILGAKHLKFAHELLSVGALTQTEYDQIKKAALKIKLPEKPTFKSDKETTSLLWVFVCLYKSILFVVSFVVKLFLGIINFFIFNLVIDNLKSKK